MIAQSQNLLISQGLHIEHVKSSMEERFDFVLKQLTLIFDNYKKQETPVFIHIKEGLPEKIAYFLTGFSQRPVSVGIAGESASGKSTIAFDMIESIENFQQKHKLNNVITRINTDDYYYDRSKEVAKAGSFSAFVKNYDLDVPEAIELRLMKEHIKTLLKREETSAFLPEQFPKHSDHPFA